LPGSGAAYDAGHTILYTPWHRYQPGRLPAAWRYRYHDISAILFFCCVAVVFSLFPAFYARAGLPACRTLFTLCAHTLHTPPTPPYHTHLYHCHTPSLHSHLTSHGFFAFATHLPPSHLTPPPAVSISVYVLDTIVTIRYVILFQCRADLLRCRLGLPRSLPVVATAYPHTTATFTPPLAFALHATLPVSNTPLYTTPTSPPTATRVLRYYALPACGPSARAPPPPFVPTGLYPFVLPVPPPAYPAWAPTFLLRCRGGRALPLPLLPC